MSTAETLSGIFFEPEHTFQALKVRPRFLVAALITIAAFMALYVSFVQRIGAETIARAQIAARSPDMTAEQMNQALAVQSSPLVQAITYASFPVVFAIIFAAGAGLYLLGVMAMGKAMSYKQALSVWVYSSLPQTLLFALVNILLLFLKSKDDIDPTAINTGGIARANLSLLVDRKARPILATILSSFDIFAFLGLFLAAVGLRVMARLSSGAAWGIALLVWLLAMGIHVLMAALFGQAS
jgi:hypothetical protein